MARFHIPDEQRGWVERFALKRWVDRRGFPRAAYFEWIDTFVERMKEKFDFEPDNSACVHVVTGMLKAEGNLADHCLGKGKATPDEMLRFSEIVVATAWVIVQKYRTDVEKGDWP